MTNDELHVEHRELSLVTVERAAYALVGLVAAALRFFQLGLRPLTWAEAVQALAALRFTQGTSQAAPAGTIPALFTGNVIGFSLVGAGDSAARWLPALAGVILALLPYGLRHRLGRGGALAASVLLALSPTAVFYSRALDGAILIAVCGLALAVGLVNYLDTRRPGFLYLAAVALGLGLCAGSGIYTLLLILAAFVLLLYLRERLLHHETGWSSLVVAWWAARGEKGLLAKVSAVLLATFGLGATAFILHPPGLGHAADLIGAWATGFLPEPNGQPLIYPLLLLLRYEPLILLLGLVEAGRAVVSRRAAPWWAPQPGSSFPHGLLLIFWAAWATLIVVVAGHRPPGNLLLVVVPLALLAGQGIERAWRWVTGRELWSRAALTAAAALGLLVFFYLQMTAYGLASPASTVPIGKMMVPTTATYLLLASLALLLLVGMGAVAWFWRGPELLVGGGWLAALLVLGLFGFKAMWGVNFAHAGDPRELMIGQTTTPEVRLLVDRLEALSLDKAGDAHTLPVTVDAATGPVVAWYLRAFDQQTVVESLANPPETVAAVTLAQQDLPIGEVFRGQGFPLRAYWQPWNLWGQGLVRWLLFTGDGQPIVDQEVVLWVANESNP